METTLHKAEMLTVILEINMKKMHFKSYFLGAETLPRRKSIDLLSNVSDTMRFHTLSVLRTNVKELANMCLAEP